MSDANVPMTEATARELLESQRSLMTLMERACARLERLEDRMGALEARMREHGPDVAVQAVQRSSASGGLAGKPAPATHTPAPHTPDDASGPAAGGPDALVAMLKSRNSQTRTAMNTVAGMNARQRRR